MMKAIQHQYRQLVKRLTKMQTTAGEYNYMLEQLNQYSKKGKGCPTLDTSIGLRVDSGLLAVRPQET